jgi:hypothetical protein
MASLHAFTQRSSSVVPAHIPVSKLEQYVAIDPSHAHKWTYLLANNIGFSNKQSKSIRLAKPEQSILLVWLEKIITSGQCATVFVEQLTADEISFKRLKQLCSEHQVTLVNLTLDNSTNSNVIQGPW